MMIGRLDLSADFDLLLRSGIRCFGCRTQGLALEASYYSLLLSWVDLNSFELGSGFGFHKVAELFGFLLRFHLQEPLAVGLCIGCRLCTQIVV